MMETVDLFDREEIIELVTENRKARRMVFPDLEDKIETYFRFVCTLDESIKYELEKAQKDFAAYLGIKYSDIIQSIAYHSEQDEANDSVDFRLQVMEVMSNVRDSLQYMIV